MNIHMKFFSSDFKIYKIDFMLEIDQKHKINPGNKLLKSLECLYTEI